jgi:hypothetical protein
MNMLARKKQILKRMQNEFCEKRWSEDIERYKKLAEFAKKWGNNPNSYAEIFRKDMREDFANYPEALKAFDEIDKELTND